MGRPSKFRDEFYKQATKLARLGATNPQMAEFFEVDTSTLDRWIADNAEFRSAIKKGKLWADANVANALYRRAVGYTVTEVTHERKMMPVGDGGAMAGALVEVKRVKKHIVPDTLACIYFLNNRQRDKWQQAPKPETDPDQPEQVFVFANQTIKFN
jgi:hypothetical protein